MNKDDLEHTGVLGMKWGIRKNREISGTKSSSSSITYTSKSTGKEYSVDKDGRISIQKGFILQRVFTAGKSSTGESGSNYFSFTKKDNDTYLAMMGAGAHSKIGFIKKLASNTMSRLSAKEDLKSPSREEAFNLLNQSLKEVGKKGFSRSFKDPSALEWYREQNSRIVKSRDSLEFKVYKKSLLKSGFNILLDEADAGFLAELPILVLDGERSLKKARISEFSKETLDSAARRVRAQNKQRTIDEISNAGQ
jgi:hypothetical protein